MRIVLDLQGAQSKSRFRGIGRYTLSLAQAVVANRGEHEVFLALNGSFPDTIEPIRAVFDPVLPQEHIRVWHAPGPVMAGYPGNDSRRQTAEHIREAFLAGLKPDVIHIGSLFEGYEDDAVTSIGRFDTSTPVSVLLHDLIPLLNPDHYLKPNPRYARYYRHKMEALEHAALFLTNSESTRREGEAHVGGPASRFVHISTAAAPCFRPLAMDAATAAALCRKLGIGRSYILYTGGTDERKNLGRLVRAYAGLPLPLRQSHQLVFAGRVPEDEIRRFQTEAMSSGLDADDLCFTGYVSDDELVMLYNCCKVFVFPSWHEGFGLPVLEAMACGAAAIGSNISSLHEVIALDDAFFDPMDVESITTKIIQVLEDDAFRALLCTHGRRQAEKFSWDATARRAIQAWESLVKFRPAHRPIDPPSGRKKRLAFVSPLPPERTGIADYSAELLPELSAWYDIDIVAAQDRVEDPWIKDHGRVRDVNWLQDHAHEMDRVLYHVGNSPFHQYMLHLMREIPGTVVLHDFFVSSLLSWLETMAGVDHIWTAALYRSHGYGAVRDRFCRTESAAIDYPVNLDILQNAQGLIVHSEYSRTLVNQWYGDGAIFPMEVIPHLRTPVDLQNRAAYRKRLGFDAGDFVLCSFGFLNPTKLNHRLLHAWLHSALAPDRRCHLIFVGENHGGDYGRSLAETIRSTPFAKGIRITGYATPEMFRWYLIAADAAVQLRTDSRGETAGTVLDCMNHALPLIINAHGSLAELDPESVWMLPDRFEDADLITALETLRQDAKHGRILGDRARNVILTRHAPAACAKHYAAAIERFHHESQTSLPALIDAIVKDDPAVSEDGDGVRLAESLSATLPPIQPARRLFFDVTTTCRTDLKTGIERAARGLLMALMEAPPAGYRIEPVYLEAVGGKWCYRHACRYTLSLLGCPPDALDDEIVEPQCGDLLIGVDLSGDTLIQAEQAGLLAAWRCHGIGVFYVVFDLLPVRLPEVFPPGADRLHDQWLRSVSRCDGALCISKAVADDLAAWHADAELDWKDRRPYRIAWFHLGADLDASAPSQGFPGDYPETIDRLRSHPTFLMVGTIEPRKGYLQVIDAFDILWGRGIDVQLVIVGREGWTQLPNHLRRDIPHTIDRMRSHPEQNKRFFWLDEVSDAFLEKIYKASTCLMVASAGEGFGLPLVEAARHGLPILARDIPVFREVAGCHARYFHADTGDQLAAAVESWLTDRQNGWAATSEVLPFLNWRQSAQALIDAVMDGRMTHP